MELSKLEISSIEDVVADLGDSQLRELNELQLALIGGGIGETVL